MLNLAVTDVLGYSSVDTKLTDGSSTPIMFIKTSTMRFLFIYCQVRNQNDDQ